MVEIEQKLYNDIKNYCKLNGLVIKDFINKLLKKAFTVEKYGETPIARIQREEQKKEPKAAAFTHVEAETKLTEALSEQMSDRIDPEIAQVIDDHFGEFLEPSKPQKAEAKPKKNNKRKL